MSINGVSEGTFAIKVDGDGIVRVVLAGMWSMETVARYSTAISHAHQQCRQAHGRVREITDSRDMPIQSQEIAAAMVGATRFQSGDRLAIIVASALARIATRGHLERQQAEGIFSEGCTREVFNSPTVAETWIQA